MDVFLIRHAIAEERRADLPDANRRLTERGRARFETVVQSLHRSGFRFDHVYHSPWLRAAETAELLEPITDGPLICTDELAQPPRAEFFASLQGDAVACVGHEPWMSDALSLLTTGDPHGPWLRFKKGGVAWLRGTPHPRSMELRALLPPRGHAPP
ncbi:MAG: histidine phosphatase family protein [Myxococcales bacterium]|nr:MAG: histidine phosphatase family protein [Myxococcales bacterium]